jgi:hypothetical protein
MSLGCAAGDGEQLAVDVGVKEHSVIDRLSIDIGIKDRGQTRSR